MAKILIVDDSWLTRRSLVAMLKKENYKIVEAEDGRKGLEAINEHKPDCILLDLLMPEIDGFGVLEAMDKEKVASVIVLSADIQDSVRKKVENYGVFAFINKPPDEKELCTIVNKSLSV